MVGCGGARKIRVSLPGSGKSGGARVVYVDFAVSERIYLLIAYTKSKQATISDSQKKAIRNLIGEIRRMSRVEDMPHTRKTHRIKTPKQIFNHLI